MELNQFKAKKTNKQTNKKPKKKKRKGFEKLPQLIKQSGN